MARILVEDPKPNGTTEFTLDLDGVRVARIVVKTSIRHELTDGDIEEMLRQAADAQRRKAKT